MREVRRRSVSLVCVFAIVLVAALVAVCAGAAAPARAVTPAHSIWWVVRGGGVNSQGWVDVAKGPDGSLYAGGYYGFDEYGASGDIAVGKFDANDAAADHQIWEYPWDNPIEHRGDQASAIAVDHSGAVVVAGSSDTASNGWEWVVLKRDKNGVQLWEKGFAASPLTDWDAFAEDVVCDAAGNVYVCGTSQTGAYDDSQVASLVVRKLSGVDGHLIWKRFYAGPTKSFNHGLKLALDAAGNVYCTGFGQSAHGDLDMITCKCRASDGRLLWLRRIDDARHLSDMGADIVVRGNRVWVAGGESASASTTLVALAKYTLAGKRLWLRTWREHTGSDAWARALAVDAHGNAVVVGASRNDPMTRDHAFVLRYTAAGALQWHRVTYDPVSHQAEWHDVVCDSAGHIWVAGYTVAGGSESFEVARYSGAGVRVWRSGWKGPDGLGGSCDALCFGKTGLFAAGVATAQAGGNDAAAVKFAR